MRQRAKTTFQTNKGAARNTEWSNNSCLIVYIEKTEWSFTWFVILVFMEAERVKRPLRHQPEELLLSCLRHTITTLGHGCRMRLPGFSPSGQEASRTKALQWAKTQKTIWQLPHWNAAVALWKKSIQCFGKTWVSAGYILTTSSVKLSIKYFQRKLPALGYLLCLV